MSETIYATGKRKTAVARVWLKPGTGAITVNYKPADEYFERETSRMIMRQPLELIEVLDQYDVVATVAGGGHSAQAEAMAGQDFWGCRPLILASDKAAILARRRLMQMRKSEAA